jgi:hypothetical protein
MDKDSKVLDYNCLGQAIDNTWGRSSTTKGAGQSVKFKVLGEKQLEVCFVAVVNLVNDSEMVDLKKRYVSEANQVIDVSIKRVKETYKELAEQSLKLKQVSELDTFEVINLNIYNRKRTAYYRRRVVYEMS